MDRKIVEHLKQQFIDYVQTFQSADSEIQQNIILKQQHTERVCQEIVMLGKQLDLEHGDLNLAEVMALFHDIGRFEQYAAYRTFVDRHSVNHAEFGIDILRRHDLLNMFEPSIQELILRVISYHNRAHLPQEETETCLFFTKLLRDADKLDIWRVVIAYYHNNNGKRNPAIELGLPDTPGISDKVYKDLMAKHVVAVDHLKNLNDFKLLQVSWIYDLNFVPTLQAVRERQYLERILATLPALEKLERMSETIGSYVEERTSSVKI